MSSYNSWRQFDGAVAYSISVPSAVSGAQSLWSLLGADQQAEISEVLPVRAVLHPVGDVEYSFAGPGTAVRGSDTPGTPSGNGSAIPIAGGSEEDVPIVSPDLNIFVAGDSASTTMVVVFYYINFSNVN